MASHYTDLQVAALGLASTGQLCCTHGQRDYWRGTRRVSAATVSGLVGRGLVHVEVADDGAHVATLTARGRELMGVRSAPRGEDR